MQRAILALVLLCVVCAQAQMFGQVSDYRGTITFVKSGSGAFDGFFTTLRAKVEYFVPLGQQYQQTFTPTSGNILILDPSATTTITINQAMGEGNQFAVVAAVPEDEVDFAGENGLETQYKPGDVLLLAIDQGKTLGLNNFGLVCQNQPNLTPIFLNIPIEESNPAGLFINPLAGYTPFCLVKESDIAAKITFDDDRTEAETFSEGLRFIRREPTIFGPVVF